MLLIKSEKVFLRHYNVCRELVLTNMIPFVDIHTHHLSKESGVFLYNNRFGFDSVIHTNSFFSVGIHPWDAHLKISTIEFQGLITHPNCMAIGECGFDKLKGADLVKQQQMLEYQLKLAVEYHKPVIIHCVKAYDEIIKICEVYHSSIPIIIHGFNKSYELLHQLLGKGFYVSLSRFAIQKMNFNFTEIPLEKLFLETDEDCTMTIQEIYQIASERFKMTEEDLKNKIYSNFTTLFKINGR